MVRIVTISSLQDPNDKQGRTYKQINAAMTHQIPLGSLVESRHLKGARGFVAKHSRDCDQTPLYVLCFDPLYLQELHRAPLVAGLPEEDLTLITLGKDIPEDA